MTDEAYDRPSALLEPTPGPTEGAYDRLLAAREREDDHKYILEGRYRDLVQKVAFAPNAFYRDDSVREWAASVATLVADYVAEIAAVHAARSDANRALREMRGPAVATRPDEATS